MNIEKKYKTKYNQIKKLLKKKNLYENTDETLIQELIYWMKLSDEAKENINQFGIVVNVVRDPMKDALYQTNQAVSILKEASTKIAALYTKLSINPQERIKIKEENIDDNNEFNEEFNE